MDFPKRRFNPTENLALFQYDEIDNNDPEYSYHFIVLAENEDDVIEHFDPENNCQGDRFEINHIGVISGDNVTATDKASDLIMNNVLSEYPLQKIIRSRFLEDGQFVRYFNGLFDDLYEEMKGIEIIIPDFENKNNRKDVIYEKVPESRLEFLMYLKSTIDYMIQVEKTEAEENNISLN